MLFMNISIKTLSVFLKELAIEWSDKEKNLLNLEKIRRSCPCAGCSGETDALGNVYKNSPTKYSDHSFDIINYEIVGRYGVRFFWKDGHHDGIYTFQLLKSLADE